MQVSNTIMEEFKTHVNNQNMTLNGVDLSVRILTTGFWPTQSSTPNCTIPNSPRLAFETFKRFYLAKHSGRQLTLQPQLGKLIAWSTFWWVSNSASISTGTSFINAVFFGIKQEQGNESEAGSSTKEVGACSSTAVSLPTRKHVLQVSTYQVSETLKLDNVSSWW